MPRPRIEEREGPLRPRLAAYIRLARRDPEVPWTVEGFAAWIGCVKQTIYNYDARVAEREAIAPRIECLRARRDRIETLRRGQTATRASGTASADARKIARLEKEVAMWRDRYHNTVEKMLLLEEIARAHRIDVDGAFEVGLMPPDRSISKAGGSGHGHRTGVGRRQNGRR